jgi:release factor glutamine methyltransferase
LSTAQELFRKAREALRGVAAEAPIEAKVILLKATGLTEEQFFASPQKTLSCREESAFNRLINGRLSGVPLAYLTGIKEFWSIPLKVVRGVFIPRPETELIVEKVLELATGREGMIVDIGTGSGNIALALAQELPRARILATDISQKALSLARLNAGKLNAGNITFAWGNLFAALAGLSLEGQCDFIVSNPPYVSAADWDTLSREVREHEPRRALVPGKTGLEFICRLIKGAPGYLKPGGHFLFEIGEGQRDGALALFDEFDGLWTGVESFADLRGIPRVVKACRAQPTDGK